MSFNLGLILFFDATSDEKNDANPCICPEL